MSSGYYNRSLDLDYGLDREQARRSAAATQLRIDPNQSDDESNNEAITVRIALEKAEKALLGRREREQYFNNKPYMKSDLERLSFLSLESHQERSRWLASQGIQGSATAHAPQIQKLIEANDITVNMTKQAVRDSWGEPELIEVAGNPLYGNERWHYSEQVSSTEGYQSELRLVYFESGRVIGWETK
jgi:hypothetical protein